MRLKINFYEIYRLLFLHTSSEFCDAKTYLRIFFKRSLTINDDTAIVNIAINTSQSRNIIFTRLSFQLSYKASITDSLSNNQDTRQLLFLNSYLHFGHVTIIFPLPLGMRIFWPHFLHLYIWYCLCILILLLMRSARCFMHPPKYLSLIPAFSTAGYIFLRYHSFCFEHLA